MQFYRRLVHNVGYVLWRLTLKINALLQKDLYHSSVKRVQELFKCFLLCSKRNWVGGEKLPLASKTEKEIGNGRVTLSFSKWLNFLGGEENISM